MLTRERSEDQDVSVCVVHVAHLSSCRSSDLTVVHLVHAVTYVTVFRCILIAGVSLKSFNMGVSVKE
jgi:hypothetical protein